MAENQIVLTTASLKIVGRLYLQSQTADVHFIFESNERIPAHKILLTNASDVFHTMFYGPLKETGDIKIVDASAKSFEVFLQFFYFDRVQLAMENIAEVMHLAKKYNFSECMDACLSFLAKNLTHDNVMVILELANTHDQLQLKESCKPVIQQNAEKIMKSPNFVKYEKQTIDTILDMDALWCAETIIFEAIISWLKVKSKRHVLTRDIVQTHLGDSFYKIAFGSMSMDEFADVLTTYGNLFSVIECCEIIQTISKKKLQLNIFKERKNLNLEWNESNIIWCFRHNDFREVNRNVLVHPMQKTVFSANKTVKFGGFRFFELYKDEVTVENVHVIVTIISNDMHIEARFSADVTMQNLCYSVTLPKPIIIEPGIKYEIQLSFPEDLHFNASPYTPTIRSGDLTVQFHTVPSWEGMDGGLVYILAFNQLY